MVSTEFMHGILEPQTLQVISLVEIDKSVGFNYLPVIINDQIHCQYSTYNSLIRFFLLTTKRGIPHCISNLLCMKKKKK
jgi:hypothetical protein